MNTARAHLNFVLDDADMPANMKADARAALNAIEEHPLLVGALRLLIDHMPNGVKHPPLVEAIAHAQRVLKAADDSAARLKALAAPREEQFADLV